MSDERERSEESKNGKESRKRDMSFAEYMDKVDQELAAGRFASQSK